MTTTYNHSFPCPLGWIRLSGTDAGITEISFSSYPGVPDKELHPLLLACQSQLVEYFEGKVKVFTFPIVLQGTDFQMNVWRELLKIPFGKTMSYLELSERLGNVLAIRAVASANAKNKLGIVVPCHRVIGHDGSLTGYAGGLWRKQRLLDLEASFSGKPHQLKLF